MDHHHLMQTIAHQYHFTCYHSTPFQDGYRLDTNCGTKKVTLWHVEDYMHWSFAWREEMAHKGFRQIDRFIRTKDGAPFVQKDHSFIVVQDVFERQPQAYPPSVYWVMLGNFMGELYRTCKAIHQRNHPTEPFPSFQFREYEQQERKRMVELRERMNSIDQSQPSMFTILVQKHLPQLEKRWRQALALRQQSSAFFLVPSLQLHDFQLRQQACLYVQPTRQGISPSFYELGSMMQEIAVWQEEALDYAELFYSAFDQVYQPNLAEQITLLSQLVSPQHFFKLIDLYLGDRGQDEEASQQWLEKCEQQDSLDRLSRWYAARIDQVRKEAIWS